MAKAPRLNDQIRISPVRLIDQDNEQRGVVDTYEALRMARELGLDLVEIAPQERPPVCRIMDYGKHKYNLKKKQKNNVSHDVTLKEVRLRPKTDDNDRNIKMNRAEKFLSQGHKVQFTMLFRGRERQHRDLALQAFQEIVEYFVETAKIERHPKFEGRRMTMMLAPVAKAPTKKQQQPKAKPAKAPAKEAKAVQSAPPAPAPAPATDAAPAQPVDTPAPASSDAS